jgi:hypothetical protein
MKQIIIFILITISSFTFSAKAFSKNTIYDEIVIKKIDSYKSHVCHMNNVYLKGNGSHHSLAYMVWNNYTGSPLTCKDYQTYTYCLENNDIDIETGMVCFFKQLN